MKLNLEEWERHATEATTPGPKPWSRLRELAWYFFDNAKAMAERVRELEGQVQAEFNNRKFEHDKYLGCMARLEREQKHANHAAKRRSEEGAQRQQYEDFYFAGLKHIAELEAEVERLCGELERFQGAANECCFECPTMCPHGVTTAHDRQEP